MIESLMMSMWIILMLGISTIVTTSWRLSVELSPADLGAFLLALMALSTAVLAVYRVVRRRIGWPILDAILFSFILTVIFWSAGFLLVKNWGWPSPLIGVLAFLYFLACSYYLLRHPSWTRTLIVAVMCAVLPNGLLLALYDPDDLNLNVSSKTGSAPNVSDIKFKQTPDIYLIGFLGASPDKVLQQSLGLKGSELSRTMERLEFRRFDAVFAEAVTTRNSYDMLLGMTREYVESFPESDRGMQFSGNIYSPLFDIFKSNGYSITTLTVDHKFGYAKGPFVDRYLVSDQLSLCKRKDLIKPAVRPYVFFGGCNLRLSRFFPDIHTFDEPAASLFVRLVESISHDDNPRLMVAHLKPPLHAPQQSKFQSKPGLLEKFVTRYHEADKEAAGHLEAIVSSIKSTKRDAILVVIGDRGVGLIHKIAASPDFNYTVEDRLLVIAGLYPANRCAQQFATSPPTTPSILRGLITCFSGQDAWPAGYEHRLLYEGGLLDPERVRVGNAVPVGRTGIDGGLDSSSIEPRE